MNTFLAALVFVALAAGVFLLVSLVLWWLVPVAFLIDFSFTQAMATAALVLLFGGLVAPKG